MVRYYENEYAWYFVLGMDDSVIVREETSVTEQLRNGIRTGSVIRTCRLYQINITPKAKS